MNRADKVTAEAKADDLLASIRRAINEEGLDELTIPDNEPRQFERPRLVSDRPEHRIVDAREIAALREKISRELNQEEPVPFNGRSQPRASAATLAPPQSLFANLLGGSERPEAVVSKPAQRAPAPLPLAPRVPPSPPVQIPLRSAFDQPGRAGASHRPPYGQSTTGIRGFQPPSRLPSDGMISAETTSVAASSFNRLSEQILGRESNERSIDDLTRELLHPMLKEWLDQNLPRIVEDLVREEIERVSRRGR
jgi:cell pole-organizing protein PopZ